MVLGFAPERPFTSIQKLFQFGVFKASSLISPEKVFMMTDCPCSHPSVQSIGALLDPERIRRRLDRGVLGIGPWRLRTNCLGSVK